MTITVETGAGIAGANSYVSLAAAQEFIDARGLTSTLTEPLLHRAMDALRDIRWKGYKADVDNALPWPRSGVVDAEGRYIPATEVPQGVIDAQCWMAYHIEQGDDPAAVPEPAVVSESVDVISTTYANNGTSTALSWGSFPNVRRALHGLTAIGGGMLDRA